MKNTPQANEASWAVRGYCDQQLTEKRFVNLNVELSRHMCFFWFAIILQSMRERINVEMKN